VIALLGQKRRLPHKSTHNPSFEAKPAYLESDFPDSDNHFANLEGGSADSDTDYSYSDSDFSNSDNHFADLEGGSSDSDADYSDSDSEFPDSKNGFSDLENDS